MVRDALSVIIFRSSRSSEKQESNEGQHICYEHHELSVYILVPKGEGRTLACVVFCGIVTEMFITSISWFQVTTKRAPVMHLYASHLFPTGLMESDASCE